MDFSQKQTLSYTSGVVPAGTTKTFVIPSDGMLFINICQVYFNSTYTRYCFNVTIDGKLVRHKQMSGKTTGFECFDAGPYWVRKGQTVVYSMTYMGSINSGLPSVTADFYPVLL